MADQAQPTTILPAAAQNTYLKAATSDNTRKAYQQDIRHFIANGGRLPTNTESIMAYLRSKPHY